MDAVADHISCTKVSPALRFQRPCLARKVQVIPDPIRQSLADRHAVRGTKSGAGQNDSGSQSSKLAMVFGRTATKRYRRSGPRSRTREAQKKLD